MDVWVLGVAAIVLIALTLWIVSQAPATDATVTTPEARDLPPVGDAFEDQYTSATADLSAGGVAEAMITRPPPITESLPAPTPFQSASEPWSSPSTARGGAPVAGPGPAPNARGPRVIGIVAAALLTLGGAVGGAWLYSRWQRERNKPVSRVRRRLFR